MGKRTTILDLQKLKQAGKRFAMVTVYSYSDAKLADEAGFPTILVGDSLNMTVAGQETTLSATLEQMVYHSKAVVRGNQKSLIVGDLPFLTYSDERKAIESAGRFMQEGNVQAIKLEGGVAVAPIVQKLVALGIPVMGHLGFTPQSVHQIGIRVQGKEANAAAHLIEDALALEEAGAFALVLELVPAQLAREITARLRIPTIGIGAGPWCDGQVQVWHDILGLLDFKPRHTRRYANLRETISAALRSYLNDVQAGTFPTEENYSSMNEQELQTALQALQAAKTEGDKKS